MILATIGLSLAWICGAVVAFRIGRCVSTPLLTWLGVYRYYSPMFFTQPFGRGRLELHLGTTWDFFAQKNVTQQVLLTHLGMGVKGLIETIKSGSIPLDTKLRGTMYFLSSPTLERLGFRVRQPLPLEYVAFVANYLEICLLLTLVRRRVSFIDIRRVRMIDATALDLVSHEHRLAPIIERLSSRTPVLLS
ncbi:MAG TPA: hypothetical protein VK147_05215 [Candidatus Didemnitutus sp.]|nr:hypothetical protein [Candidatus Didemnitutus sp.]